LLRMVARVLAALAVLTIVDGERINRKKNPSHLSTCGVKGASGPSGQIVNGQAATECEWRWQAMLYRSYSFCGGTLISPEWVLTAAHCVSSPNFDVIVGNYNSSTTSGNQQRRSAVEVFQHPEYSSSPTRNDFALVRLESPVTINECVGTACLPTAGADVAPNSKCWITGWGTLRAGGSGPTILQEAEVGILSNADCVNNKGYTSGQIDDTMICAQGKTADGKITDACQGDSGGPLVCENEGQWTVYGATSWGRGCAGENYPGIWARVHKELGWIEDILAGISTPPGACPAETSSGPDRDNDCRCNSGLSCFEDGNRGCTYSYSEQYGTSLAYFLPTCSGCECE